ncbi:MAG: hypothetical protein AAF531_23575, partial [Actinomycetota bacterium]
MQMAAVPSALPKPGPIEPPAFPGTATGEVPAADVPPPPDPDDAAPPGHRPGPATARFAPAPLPDLGEDAAEELAALFLPPEDKTPAVPDVAPPPAPPPAPGTQTRELSGPVVGKPPRRTSLSGRAPAKADPASSDQAAASGKPKRAKAAARARTVDRTGGTSTASGRTKRTGAGSGVAAAAPAVPSAATDAATTKPATGAKSARRRAPADAETASAKDSTVAPGSGRKAT